MHITLKQRDVELALKMYLASQGVAVTGREFAVDFTAGRKPGGLLAEIAIGDKTDIEQVIKATEEAATPKLLRAGPFAAVPAPAPTEAPMPPPVPTEAPLAAPVEEPELEVAQAPAAEPAAEPAPEPVAAPVVEPAAESPVQAKDETAGPSILKSLAREFNDTMDSGDSPDKPAVAVPSVFGDDEPAKPVKAEAAAPATVKPISLFA